MLTITTPTTIIEQLKRDEGLKLWPYTDTIGKTTIGWGRNLTDTGISSDEADLLLSNDIARVSAELARMFPWTSALDQVRLGAFLNLAFNLGITGLAEFKNMLTYAQAGNWTGAAAELLNSKAAEEEPARIHRLATQLETDVWQ
jgi:lysozyme